MTGGNSPRSIVAIDPGPEQSACVLWNGEKIWFFKLAPNTVILDLLRDWPVIKEKILVIEQVVSLGMPVGASVFETVFWSGRFVEVWTSKWDRISRKDVKMHLCNSMRAKDSNIRQALIDRFGPPGTKKAPGLTYGLKRDLWSAFALAVTFYDLYIEGKND